MENPQDLNELESILPETEKKSDLSSGPGGGCFEIHVRGHLNSAWSDWLEGLEIKLLDDGEMILSGSIVDQAALMGILNKLNRLNLTLLSVNEVKSKD
jgi:hypothetical protein